MVDGDGEYFFVVVSAMVVGSGSIWVLYFTLFFGFVIYGGNLFG